MYKTTSYLIVEIQILSTYYYHTVCQEESKKRLFQKIKEDKRKVVMQEIKY